MKHTLVSLRDTIYDTMYYRHDDGSVGEEEFYGLLDEKNVEIVEGKYIQDGELYTTKWEYDEGAPSREGALSVEVAAAVACLERAFQERRVLQEGLYEFSREGLRSLCGQIVPFR